MFDITRVTTDKNGHIRIYIEEVQINGRDQHQGHDTQNAAEQCATCKKHIPHTLTCKAYPEQIPEEIIFGEKTCKEREKSKVLSSLPWRRPRT